MNKNDFLSALEMLKNGTLEKINGKISLTPGYPYLFYTLDTEFSGRKVYNNVNITTGYYNSNEKYMSENYIMLKNAINVEYSTTNKNIEPFDDMKKYNLGLDEADSIPIEVSQYTQIYKLPFPPMNIERIPNMKENLEEMRWMPEESKNIPFIGESYRENKENFEKKYQGKGGRKSRRKQKRKSKRRINKSRKYNRRR